MINAKRESALIGEQRPSLALLLARAIVFPGMPISIAIYQANGSRSPRYQFPEEEADKEARRKMGSNRGNSIAKSYASSTGTRCRSRLAIRRRYFIEEISSLPVPPRRHVQPPGVNVDRVGAVHHGDSLKDIPDDRLSGCANNGGDTRARVARGRADRGGGGRGKRGRFRSPSSAWNA